MSLDYIFFDDGLRDRFVAFVAERGVSSKLRPDTCEGQIVELPGDLADDVGDEIERHYDVLMDEQRALVDAADDPEARDLMGVNVALADGRRLMVRLPARYARPLVKHFTGAEIQGLIEAIAESLLDPSDAPLCCRDSKKAR